MTPQAPEVRSDPLVEQLRTASARQLDALVPAGSRIALIDVPTHGNVGDHAIWLGECAYLQRRGVRLVYLDDIYSYDELRLRRLIGNGKILLHGGGNLGDLWQEYQRQRERIIGDFADTPIVQLPQSVHFTSREGLERAKAIFDAHPNLTVLARDRTSEAFLRAEFGIDVRLCPDSAFHLDPPPATTPPELDVLVVGRTDNETRVSAWPSVEGRSVLNKDWLEVVDPVAWNEAYRRLLYRFSRLSPAVARVGPVASRALAPFARLAAIHVAAGFALLGRARVVVSDRLHVHILCLIAGIPHVLVDNSYGKLSSFTAAWTGSSDLLHWADTPEAALEAAREVLDRKDVEK